MKYTQKNSGALLLVEDNKGDQKLITLAFSELNISNEIVIVNTAKGALEFLRTEAQPMLILCDINLPGTDGLTLREETYKDDTLRKKCIPFIFLSSDETTESVEKAFYDFPVQGYFAKAKNFDDAVELLKIVINYWKLCRHPHSMFHLLKMRK